MMMAEEYLDGDDGRSKNTERRDDQVRSRRSNKIRCQSPIVVVVAAAAVVVVVVVVVYLKVLVLNRQGMRQRNQLLSKDILSNTDLVLELAGIIRHRRKPIETKTCQKDFPLSDQPDPQLHNILDF